MLNGGTLEDVGQAGGDCRRSSAADRHVVLDAKPHVRDCPWPVPRRGDDTHPWRPPLHTLIHAAALALAATGTTVLAAQSGGAAAQPANAACALVTEKEVEAATGLDYDPGSPIEAAYERIPGGATCHWGGPGGGLSATGVLVRDDKPEIGITLIANSPRGSHTEWQRKQRLLRGCTRESAPGIGGDAFAEICEQAPYGVSVYARTGKRDVLVRVYHVERKGWSKASVKPAAIALAKVAAARATGK